MAWCFDNYSNRYDSCTSHLSTYVAVGVIIPLAILLLIALVYLYARCRQRRLRGQQQQTYMATIIPLYNNDQQQNQVPYNYSYPPHYTPMPEDAFGKPPSYEQTVQQISETNNNNNNNNNLAGDSPAILPVTTMTASSQGPVASTRN